MDSLNYDKDSIKSLNPLAHIRLRPGMYIPNTDIEGLHHLFHECIDNAVDEFLAGHADRISVILDTRGNVDEITVGDNGRGVPVGFRKDLNMDVLTAIYTKTLTGGKFEGSSYTNSSGTFGIGIKCVTALSKSMFVSSFRKDKWYQLKVYNGGSKIHEVTESDRDSDIPDRGTEVSFTPDPEIFGNIRFDFERMKRKCSTLASLLPGLTVHLHMIDSSNKPVMLKYKYNDPLNSIHEDTAQKPELLIKDGFFQNNRNTLRLGFYQSISSSVTSFINTVETIDRGSHVSAILDCISKSILRIKGKPLTHNQVLNGVNLTLSVFFPHPTYRGQAKTQVSDKRVYEEVYNGFYNQVYEFLKNNPSIVKYLVDLANSQEKAVEEIELKNVAKEISNNMKENKLPIDLSVAHNCKIEEREIILVEGKSAAGSVKSARNPRFQEVLPLRGKVLNPYKVEFSDILKSKEVLNIFNALGGVESSYGSLRAHKILVMADADSDAAHIVSLICSLFTTLFPTFIQKYQLYIVHPPLFTLVSGDSRVFGMSVKDCEAKAKKLKLKNWEVYRNKGLGECSANELKEFIDPATRSLTRVTLTDASADRMRELMGTDGETRRQMAKELEFNDEDAVS
jgi:DNA gyrase subunit B